MSNDSVQRLAINRLDPHPDNPRIVLREDVISAIDAKLAGGYPQEMAILVRPIGDRYQIVSGHHRKEAARRRNIPDIPAWVKEMTDEEAFMELVSSNSQSELAGLEIGLHALRAVPLSSGGRGQTGGLREYARRIGRDESYVRQCRDAADVFVSSGVKTAELTPQFLKKTQCLHEIAHAAKDRWPELVRGLVENGWSVQETRRVVSGKEQEPGEPRLVGRVQVLRRALKDLIKEAREINKELNEPKESIRIHPLRARFGEFLKSLEGLEEKGQ